MRTWCEVSRCFLFVCLFVVFSEKSATFSLVPTLVLSCSCTGGFRNCRNKLSVIICQVFTAC